MLTDFYKYCTIRKKLSFQQKMFYFPSDLNIDWSHVQNFIKLSVAVLRLIIRKTDK